MWEPVPASKSSFPPEQSMMKVWYLHESRHHVSSILKELSKLSHLTPKWSLLSPATDGLEQALQLSWLLSVGPVAFPNVLVSLQQEVSWLRHLGLLCLTWPVHSGRRNPAICPSVGELLNTFDAKSSYWASDGADCGVPMVNASALKHLTSCPFRPFHKDPVSSMSWHLFSKEAELSTKVMAGARLKEVERTEVHDIAFQHLQTQWNTHQPKSGLF